MSFLVVEKLDDADQFILGRDFVRNFDVMIELDNGLIRIRNPDQKYVKKPVNRIITDENKVPIFLDRKVKLQLGQAVAFFSMRNLNSLSDSKQVCLVPKLEMRTKFQDFEAAVNDRMKKIFNQLKERGKNYSSNKFEYKDDCIEDLEEADMSTQFLRIQKNQLFDLKQHLERYINILPVFGFQSGRYDLNLIKSYLIPYLIRDEEQKHQSSKKRTTLYLSTLFEKLEGFSLPVSEDKKLFNYLAIFDFESICVPTEEIKETQTTTWIGKHVPISVSLSSNLIDEPIFLYNKDPQNLIIDFVSNLELLADQSKLEMRKNFKILK